MIRIEGAFGKQVGGVTAGLIAALMSTSAFAQCVTTSATGGGIVSLPPALIVPGTTASTAIASAIGNVNTAFLTQQGSAFVSAPANPAPGQEGGGVWVRGVGGQVTTRSNTAVASTGTDTGVQVATTTTNCAVTQKQDFAGAQVGADIARLNWNGWNVHLGSTAGYLGSKSTDNNAFSNKYDIPFFGTYLVATKDRFFADIMVRQEFYNVSLNNPTALFFDRPVSAHGYSISASAGYNFALANNWFIEPSAGFIYSRTKVDDFTQTNNFPGAGFDGITARISTNDVISEIGRLSVRVGTTIATPNVVWQPFASASVFHEFAGNVSSSYTTYANNIFYTGAGNITSNFSTTRVGTYGQYSVGLAGQIVNSGWLGFVRGDYRNGDRIEGWTANAGLRYQFTPGAFDAMAADMPMKVKAVRPIYATNWTGLYVGGFFGGDYGRTDIGFAGAPATVQSGARPWAFGPLGGGQVGYNHQFPNNWVIGVEGDVGAAAIKGSRLGSSSLDGAAIGVSPAGFVQAFSPAYYTLVDRTNWVATATARLGYSWGRTLYYVRGGGAWEDSTISASCALGPTASAGTGARVCSNQFGVQTPGGSTGSFTRAGWLIGFGTEFDLGRNWSAKTEYNYIDFGNRHTALASDGTTVLTDRAYTNQVKVGVNYRFGPGAVVAKY